MFRSLFLLRQSPPQRIVNTHIGRGSIGLKHTGACGIATVVYRSKHQYMVWDLS